VGTMAEALAHAGWAADEVASEPQQGPPETMEDQARRLAHRVAELGAECAVLAVALDEDRHEYDPDDLNPGWCRCRYRADSRWHRTAAWVRRRHGFGAT